MGELSAQLGNKLAGQLIRSEDWNSLVAAVENIKVTLNEHIVGAETQFEAVNNHIQDLKTEVNDLKEEFNAFRESLEPLLREYYRVTMETTKVNYAIGELAEITARITDLQGNPLDLTNVAQRPWIDFVVAWGQLKPVAGFESRGGVGDRTIAVQTNLQGIARVRLRSEHAEGFTDEAEDEVATFLTTKLVENSKSIVDIVLEAATPRDEKVKVAFRTLTAEYDRPDAINVRNYMDIYYRKDPTIVTGKIMPTFRSRWRDYRSTVMAFAKRDSDPRTPDQSRGISSIQITFRDWIFPWITLDYMEETASLVKNISDRFAPKVTKNFSESVTFIKSEVNDIVRDKGLIGKQRDYKVINAALDQLNVPQPPEFLNKLTKSIKNAVNIQQTLEIGQTTAFGAPGREVAFEVFTDTTVQADNNVAAVKSELIVLQQKMSEVEGTFGNINNKVSNLESNINNKVSKLESSVGSLGGRLDVTLAEGGEFQRIRADLSTVSRQVEILQGLDPSIVKTKLIEIDGLSNRLAKLEGGR
ncbi:hypothetical protein U27_05597 [Candidatus Vecturithrix granuli]|uniref:Uncharacterized protein n=1 Tax=Vecturithrix granuli TaxID=1499967 RepID=A0A081C218_VECG1|nr:hypothetical protein U27_05597 [Candidatus Vecturithrix granuli]